MHTCSKQRLRGDQTPSSRQTKSVKKRKDPGCLPLWQRLKHLHNFSVDQRGKAESPLLFCYQQIHNLFSAMFALMRHDRHTFHNFLHHWEHWDIHSLRHDSCLRCAMHNCSDCLHDRRHRNIHSPLRLVLDRTPEALPQYARRSAARGPVGTTSPLRNLWKKHLHDFLVGPLPDLLWEQPYHINVLFQNLTHARFL